MLTDNSNINQLTAEYEAKIEYLSQQKQMLQQTCDHLTQQLQDIAEDPIRWLLLTQTRSVEKPVIFQYPYEEGLVSVVIPAYNAEKFLNNAVVSVWRQEVSDDIRLEIIVIDDGSQDDTYQIANLLAQVSPVPMRVLSHPGRANKGVAASRNLGIIESKGQWIAFLDADDEFLPNKTLVQVTWLKQNPEYLCVCSYGHNVDSNGKPVNGWNSNQIAGDYQTIDPKARISDPYTFDSLQSGSPVVNSTFLTYRDVFLWSGLLPEFIAHQVEDWILFTKISIKWSIPLIKEPLIYYRVHPSSWTTRYFNENLAQGVKLEFLFAITHWLACKQEYQEIAKKFYRKNFPNYFSLTARVNDWINEYIKNKKNLDQNGTSELLTLSSKDFEEQILVNWRQDMELLKKINYYKSLAKKSLGIPLVSKIMKKIKHIFTRGSKILLNLSKT